MRRTKAFTLVELLTVIAISGIGLGIIVGAMNGNSILPSRETCTSQGGKWTEGIQYGIHTAFCTYD